MNRLIPWRISFHLLIGLSLGTFLFWPGVTGLAHQTTAAKLKSETKKTSVTFEPPNENEPDNTVGGASRDGGGVCLAENASSLSPSTGELLPLTPLNNYGLTVADRPTFYAYLPSSDRVTKIFFNVQDRTHQTVYQTEFSVHNPTGGIISFSLPEDAPPLEVGTDYQWSMVLMCDRKMRPDSPRVTAGVKRVELLPTISNQMGSNQMNDLELAAFYAQHGIWYDSLNILATLWHQEVQTSTNYVQQWVNFLSQEPVGLEEIAHQPLLEQPLLADRNN